MSLHGLLTLALPESFVSQRQKRLLGRTCEEHPKDEEARRVFVTEFARGSPSSFALFARANLDCNVSE
jgi:hypothetical protein